ncbi:2-hydroxyacid dehydrogenase [Pyramidobacter piscolens]|uniref:2-hydroxyacid dehydrogenase n=1 Tax=Pyramidobacter piscolens TaxID=638849 RepID=UPI003AB881AF
MNKVVIVGRVPDAGRKILYERCAGRYDVAEVLSNKELAKHLDGTYYILRGFPMGAAEIEKLGGDARLIHRWGVGFDAVDIEAAGKKGIIVSICAGVNSQPVAELTVMLMLASLRHLPELMSRAKAGRKDKEDIIARSWLISGKRVGLVGLGSIGRRVAAAVGGMGAEVTYYDPFRAAPETEKELGVEFLPLDELLKSSDIVSLHMPLLDSTRHLIDAAALAKMKPSALLVNTARGGIVDTEALLKALAGKRLFGAALDTIENEPLPAGHPAFSLENLIITPHAGGNTEDNNRNMAAYIMDNIDAMESGRGPTPRSVVNRQFLGKQRISDPLWNIRTVSDPQIF